MDNYRPIPILPVLTKVLEWAVHLQLYNYLQQHKILTPLISVWFSDNIDQGQLTGAVFIDLRKAFDTVDHAVLLGKLSNMGIVGQEHDWFSGYMNRAPK